MSGRPTTNGRTYVATGNKPGRPKARPEQLKKRAHGTRARYAFGESGQDRTNGCRCEQCGAAAWSYELKRRINKKRGHEPFVDATETRKHLLWLSSAGVGSWTVAEVSGVSRSTIQRITRGTSERIRPEIANKLLAINLSHAHPNGRITARRTLELVAECKREGIPEAHIANLLGYKKNSLQLKRSGRMSPERAQRIADACLLLLAPIHTRRELDAARKRDERARKAETATAGDQH
jgi:hypothetical protein